METLSDSSDSLVPRLEGFEGRMDLLLDLARLWKVDLAKVSIAALADQYLAVIEDAATCLERAADWPVMAAWLADKTALPKPSEDAVRLAEALIFTSVEPVTPLGLAHRPAIAAA